MEVFAGNEACGLALKGSSMLKRPKSTETIIWPENDGAYPEGDGLTPDKDDLDSGTRD